MEEPITILQNEKWRNWLSDTQLTKIISNIKGKYGLGATSEGFSWRDLEIDGENVIPTAMDQKSSGLCIIYSCLSIFKFQLNLLKTEDNDVKYFSPSKKYMIRVLNRIEDSFSLDLFLMELVKRNLTDHEEFSTINSLAMNQVKRFAVRYEYIEPTLDDGIAAMKEAIEVAGGVIITVIVYKVEHGKKFPKQVTVPLIVQGRKRRWIKKDVGHAKFGYGWKMVDGKTNVLCLNSHGVYNDDEGHDVCTDVSDILEVFVPQLSFNITGFR